MNYNNLVHKITEILVQTQYAAWIDKKPETAEEVNSQQKRAIKHYIGLIDEKGLAPKGFYINKFHRIVKLQVGMILRAVKDAQNEPQ